MSAATLWQQLTVALGLAHAVPPALAGREPLSIEDIKSRYYSDSDIPIEELRALWSDVADTFQVDPKLMRPTDRFVDDLPLRTFFGMNDEDVILGGCVNRRMKQRGMSGPTPEMKTVDDYVRFFMRHDRSAAAN